MKIKRGLWLVGIVSAILLVFSSIALGDEIETKDRRLFEGEIIQGMPEVISLDEIGVIANIERAKIREIRFEEKTIVETATGNTFEGEIVSYIADKLVIRTKTGEVEVKLEDIYRITFPLKRITGPELRNEVEIRDGRVYKGNIIYGIPERITIEERGIVSHIDRDQIKEIRYEEEDVIETLEDEVIRGKILTSMPPKIELETGFGSLEIKKEDTKRIRFIPTIVRTEEERIAREGSPWNYFLLEGVVGSLGAAGGAFVGGLTGAILCLSGDIALCLYGVVGGIIIGTATGAVVTVNIIGSMNGVQGNISLGWLFALGGWLAGSNVNIPFAGYLGAGFGAALGYNIGAKMKSETTVGSLDNFTLTSVTVYW